MKRLVVFLNISFILLVACVSQATEAIVTTETSKADITGTPLNIEKMPTNTIEPTNTHTNTPTITPNYLPTSTSVQQHELTLKELFGRYGIRFGFAVTSGSFVNPVARQLIADHAAVVTTENALKMEYTQPVQGVFDFSEGDAIIAYADELDIFVHGSTASWSLQNPDWLNNGTFTKQELKYILSNHVSTLSSHYAGKLVSLDTANEGYFGCGPWCPLGNEYINISFESVQDTVPLVYNSIFPNTYEQDKALALLDSGLADGIGIQLHLSTTTDWQTALARTDVFLNRIRNHGGWARFSEVGVHGDEQGQAFIYAEVIKLAIKHKDIIHDVVLWGVHDPAWRGDVTLFDNNGQPKLAYDAIVKELER